MIDFDEQILHLAIQEYGVESQKMMAIEECSELINALSKERRGRTNNQDVITEIADVMIMCEQLSVIYGRDKVEREINYKTARLKQRLLNNIEKKK